MIDGLVLALLLPVALAAQDQPASDPSAPAPIVTRSAPSASAARAGFSISWKASEITCDSGVTFGADAIPARIPSRATREPSTQPRVIYTFTLGPEGRALSIAPEGRGRRPRNGLDLAPALAAARFAPQPEPTACAVTFTQTAVPFTQAPLADLVALRVHDRRARIPSEAWDPFTGGACDSAAHSAGTRALEWHTPDYRKLPKRPGANHWTFQTYDIDEAGVPRNLVTVESSGSDALNKAARKAALASRFIDEDPREGCWRYHWMAPAVIAAPDLPDMSDYGAMPEACEAEDKWARAPTLTYPTIYERRGVEGWVVLKYDVAPWGEIGGVEVLDAQPALDLAEFAKPVLTSARYKPLENGLSGCIERVQFALPEKAKSRGRGD